MQAQQVLVWRIDPIQPPTETSHFGNRPCFKRQTFDWVTLSSFSLSSGNRLWHSWGHTCPDTECVLCRLPLRFLQGDVINTKGSRVAAICCMELTEDHFDLQYIWSRFNCFGDPLTRKQSLLWINPWSAQSPANGFLFSRIIPLLRHAYLRDLYVAYRKWLWGVDVDVSLSFPCFIWYISTILGKACTWHVSILQSNQGRIWCVIVINCNASQQFSTLLIWTTGSSLEDIALPLQKSPDKWAESAA